MRRYNDEEIPCTWHYNSAKPLELQEKKKLTKPQLQWDILTPSVSETDRWSRPKIRMHVHVHAQIHREICMYTERWKDRAANDDEENMARCKWPVGLGKRYGKMHYSCNFSVSETVSK